MEKEKNLENMTDAAPSKVFEISDKEVNSLLQDAATSPALPFAPSQEPVRLDRVSENKHGGPQFKGNDTSDIKTDISQAKKDGWSGSIRGFISNNKSFLLIPIALLVTVAAMWSILYTLNSNESINTDTLSSSSLIVSEDTLLNTEATPIFPTGAAIAAESVFIQEALSGDGITHLARKSLYGYLGTSWESLSAQQKIYAEDYVQNSVGNYQLALGQKVEFSPDVLREAYSGALSLESWQIENLTQYTTSS